jgi:hypothetical protein
MKKLKLFIIWPLTVLLLGCQNTSLDDQIDMASALDMTFCNGFGISRLVTGHTSTDFICNNKSRFSIPAKTVFESDAEYIAEHYDIQTEVTDVLCPDSVRLLTRYRHARRKENNLYLVECKGAGVATIEAGAYSNTIDEQLEFVLTMSSQCSDDSPFRLTSLEQDGNKKSIKFKCGQSRYDIITGFLSDITLDEIESINALSCNYTGFKSFNYNNRRVTFQCGNGFKNTLKL